MKNYLFVLVVLMAAVLFNSCQEDIVTDQQPDEFSVDAFQNVSVDGRMKVVFNNQSTNLKSAVTSGQSGNKVSITARGDLRNSVKVRSEGGTLTVSADDDVDLSDSVQVEIWTGDLDEIRLEADQEAIFIGNINQEELRVVTEARSKLTLLGVEVDRLLCKTEGESEFVIATNAEGYDGTRSYDESRGALVDDFTLLVDSTFIVTGDSIKLADEKWVVYGRTVAENFRMTYCEFKTEGHTLIDAQNAPAKDIIINLEGSSEALIWATETLTGKGEGSSVLYFRATDGLDLSNFITEGNAQVVPIP